MRTDSEIMTAIAHKSSMLRQLNEEESKRLKLTLTGMFTDLNNLCEENGLDLILVGGSALGAVRHKGFIPWDDDLDVALSRTDYDKLLSLLESGALGEKYEFTYPSPRHDSKNLFLKIYLKNTVNSEIMDLYTPFPKGIYLDVFPIENAYAPGWKNKISSVVSKVLSFISVSVLYHEYPSKEFEAFMGQSDEGRKRYKLRRLIGKIAGVKPHRFWVSAFDRFVRNDKIKSNYVTIPTGRKGYKGETVKREVMFPPSEGEFEGIRVKLPGMADEYLRNLYGNYMTIPPESKRERHYVVTLRLN